MSENAIRSDETMPEPAHGEIPGVLETLLRPLASLKLTVALFGMAIFIVLAGTLAQVNADVWDVVDEYFRIKPSQLRGSAGEVFNAFVVRIPTKIFAPEAFFPSRPADKFHFTLPEGWEQKAPGPFQKATFGLAGKETSESSLTVSVSVAKGSLEDNINRWRGQIDLPPSQLDQMLASAKKVMVDGTEAQSFTLEGAKETILGVVVPQENGAWFFKARGPNDVIEKEREKMESFVGSVRFSRWPSLLFPKGWVIGGLMLLNLLSAHLIRFRLQAKGGRLGLGIGLIALGFVVTWLVIASGNNQDGFQSKTLVSYETLWTVLKFSLLCLSAGCAWLGLVTPSEHRTERWTALLISGGLFASFGISALWGDVIGESDASMRILYQLVKGTIAGLVLLAGCQVLFRKRAGIVLLHGGVALLMISEVLVGVGAVESRMSLFEGEQKNSMFDLRRSELVVVDASDPKTDTVTVVPVSLLQKEGATVSDEQLPFDLEVVDFMKNAILPEDSKPNSLNLATQGAGLQHQVEERAGNVGVSSEGGVDTPALYVRLKEKGTRRDLGVWLTHYALRPQTVNVGGKDYQIELRFEETYLPYSLKLLDVRKDDYVGTSTPRNYSSKVILADTDQNLEQEVTIWMNNPLRYRGLTFYQSDYGRDGAKERTTFQVVNNAGWMIPYVSCMIVGVGMCYQFVLTLLRFLNRWERTQVQAITAVTEPATSTALTPKQLRRQERARLEEQGSSFNWGVWVPVIVCVLSAGYVLSKAREPRVVSGEMNLRAFAELPLAYEGRIKPFDSLARNTLLIVAGRQDYRDKENKKQPAIRWLLDVITGRPEANDAKVYHLTNLEVLKFLELEPRAPIFLYSRNEFASKIDDLRKEISAAENVPPESRTLFQRGLLETGRLLSRQDMLEVAFLPQLPDLPTEEDFKADRAKATERARSLLMASIDFARRLEQSEVPLAIPVPAPEQESNSKAMDPLAQAGAGIWQPNSTALLRAYIQKELQGVDAPEQVVEFQRILSAYKGGNAADFNASVAKYRDWIADEAGAFPTLDLAKVRFERFFNHFAPFYWSMILCVGVFLLSAASWLGFSEPLRRSALWLMILTFVVHTFALAARIYISGRPPVTNLYSTGIFIGWAVVLFGIVCEKLYPLGVGNAVASIAGFITLGISHFLSEGGDTFTVLQAVLDTQFWLATHVVTINLGYAATAASGLFGAYYIVYSLIAPKADATVQKAVLRMAYGSLCFAMLFSFVGTVLGGLWADDSWGRFWGWDPKENGALIIVLWNALVLHAKWDGMIRDRGMAVLSTLGLIAVSWSWFGTNQLGTGLHSYGFTDAARIGLFTCWGISLALGIVGAVAPFRRGSSTLAASTTA